MIKRIPFIAHVTCVSALLFCMAGGVKAEPYAPLGLADKHDYNTVDISTLNRWEYTFVPEARKEPVFRQAYTLFDWVVDDHYPQAEFCQGLHDQVLAWDDVEILEPVLRANRYGDPKFKDWHDTCPGFFPHVFTEEETHDFRVRYGSNHFKVFELPDGVLRKDEVLLYFHDYRRAEFIDGYGETLIGPAEYAIDNEGSYRVVNPQSCEIKYSIGHTSTNPFSYYEVQRSVSEHVLLKAKGGVYAAGWYYNVSPYIHSGLKYFKISETEDDLLQPDCVFKLK